MAYYLPPERVKGYFVDRMVIPVSEVNADGTLLNPQMALLQEAHLMTNSLTSPEPDQWIEEQVNQTQGDLGQVGGVPHCPQSPSLSSRTLSHKDVSEKHRP